MATKAAKHALEAAGISSDAARPDHRRDGQPDMQLPSTAMFVQRNLGARPDCPGFDLAAACAGFIYGLSVADAYVRTGMAATCWWSGSSCSAASSTGTTATPACCSATAQAPSCVGPSEDRRRGILSTHLYADGSQIESLYIPAGGTRTPLTPSCSQHAQHLVHMIGKEVFKYAVKALAPRAKTAMKANGIDADQVDWLIPHQANLRIIEAVLQRSGIPRERCFINIDRTANTSSASVPIALDQAVRTGKIKPGQTLLFCALGGGFAWGSAALRW